MEKNYRIEKTLKKPTIAKALPYVKKQILCFTKDNDELTNGCWLIKKQFIKKELMTRYEKIKSKNVTSEYIPNSQPIWDICKNLRLINVEFKVTLIPKNTKETHLAFYENEKHETLVNFNANFIGYFSATIPNFRIECDIEKPDKSPAIMFSKNEVIGIIMPMQDNAATKYYLENK